MLNNKGIAKARRLLDIKHPVGNTLDKLLFDLFRQYGRADKRIGNLNLLDVPSEDKTSAISVLTGRPSEVLQKLGFKGNHNLINPQYDNWNNLLKTLDSLRYHITSSMAYDSDIYRVADRLVDIAKDLDDKSGNVVSLYKNESELHEQLQQIVELSLMNKLKPSSASAKEKFVKEWVRDVYNVWQDVSKDENLDSTIVNLYTFGQMIAKARGLPVEVINQAMKQFSPNFEKLVANNDKKVYNNSEINKLFAIMAAAESSYNIRKKFGIDDQKAPETPNVVSKSVEPKSTPNTTPQPVKDVKVLQDIISKLPQRQRNELITNLLKQFTSGVG